MTREEVGLRERLARLGDWLRESEGSDGVDSVMRASWEHLDYNLGGSETVRDTELQRLANAGSAEDRVRSDYTGRYAIELLQNAHDACADADRVGQAWLVLTRKALLVANEGVPFTAERVYSLMQLGDSTKKADRAKHHTIGYKGIGFTAVLEITDRPQVVSAEAAFTFDRAVTRARIAKVLALEPRGVPLRYFPFPLTDEELGEDVEAVLRLREAGAVTVVRLPLRNRRVTQAVRRELEDSLRPETLLFMPHLNRITLTTPDRSTTWTRRAGHQVGAGQVQHLMRSGARTESWLVAQKRVALPKIVVRALDDPLWSAVTHANVAVALPWRDGRPDPRRDDQPLHVYFATDDRLGRPLLVHGDFYVQSNRRRIAAHGRGAEVSYRVADGAADLVTKLALGLTGHGDELLRTLASRGQPDGFGSTLAERIDARLRDAAILRPASGGSTLTPATARRVHAPLGRRQLAALVDLLGNPGDILRPGDDEGCGGWLDELGAQHVPPAEIAKRLTPRPGMSYDRLLSVVGRWHATLNGYQRTVCEGELRQRPLLQDQDGNWSTPRDLIAFDRRTPPVPAPLKRATYLEPNSKTAREFASKVLPVGVLTPDRALEDVLNHVLKQSSDAEVPGVLEFLRALWRTEPSLFRSAGSERLGKVPVPARVLGGRGASGYAPAGSVYFGKRWTGAETLERVYGHFRKCEFLAADPPAVGSQTDKQFWRALGVSDAPRMLPLSQVRSAFVHTWRALDEIQEAMVCPDGHPGSSRHFDGTVIDRLDEILEHADPRVLRALARHLLSLPKPLGDPVQVTCDHSAHRRLRGRPTIGYQRWLLTTRAWLPTQGGPGDAVFRRPQEAWVDVPRGAARSVLASPALAVADPTAAGIGTIHHPDLDRLEDALLAVHAEHPDLGAASSALHEGLDWLVRKLDTAARRGGELRGPIPLPAWQGGQRIWSTEPVIADVPGILQVSTMAWLEDGAWPGLQRSYGIARASASIGSRVSSTAAGGGARRLLSRTDQVQLLALLIDRGGDAGSLAFRLGNLDEQRVESLTVDYWLGGRTWIDRPAFHINTRRDSRGSLRGATLASRVGLESADLVTLGYALAQYLGVSDAGDLIGFYLTSREALLSAHRVLSTQLAEAEEALRKYRAGDEAETEADDAPDQPSDKTPTSDAATEETDTASAQRAEAGESQPEDSFGDVTSTGPTSSARQRAPHSAGSLPARPGAEAKGSGGVGGGRTDGSDRATAPAAARRSDVRFGERQRQAGGVRASEQPTPRGRSPRTGERPGAGTTGHLAPSDAADRRATEKAAEDIAVAFLERDYAAKVERVGDQNLGWDLTATLPDGNQLWVEVKGFAGTSPDFVITRGELAAADETPAYRFCIVTGVGGSAGRLAWVEDVSELLAEEYREPYQWVVRKWDRAHLEWVPWSDE